jgi:hypothetical protein
MSDNLNIDLVFPIRDDVSARLMWIKAELLYDAGIINAKELVVVTERAAAVVDHPEVADEPAATNQSGMSGSPGLRRDTDPRVRLNEQA